MFANVRFNVNTPTHGVVKISQLMGGPWRKGPPPMVQPAQWLIRPGTRTKTSFLCLTKNMVFLGYLRSRSKAYVVCA